LLPWGLWRNGGLALWLRLRLGLPRDGFLEPWFRLGNGPIRWNRFMERWVGLLPRGVRRFSFLESVKLHL